MVIQATVRRRQAKNQRRRLKLQHAEARSVASCIAGVLQDVLNRVAVEVTQRAAGRHLERLQQREEAAGSVEEIAIASKIDARPALRQHAKLQRRAAPSSENDDDRASVSNSAHESSHGNDATSQREEIHEEDNEQGDLQPQGDGLEQQQQQQRQPLEELQQQLAQQREQQQRKVDENAKSLSAEREAQAQEEQYRKDRADAERRFRQEEEAAERAEVESAAAALLTACARRFLARRAWPRKRRHLIKLRDVRYNLRRASASTAADLGLDDLFVINEEQEANYDDRRGPAEEGPTTDNASAPGDDAAVNTISPHTHRRDTSDEELIFHVDESMDKLNELNQALRSAMHDGLDPHDQALRKAEAVAKASTERLLRVRALRAAKSRHATRISRAVRGYQGRSRLTKLRAEHEQKIKERAVNRINAVARQHLQQSKVRTNDGVAFSWRNFLTASVALQVIAFLIVVLRCVLLT